MRKVLFVAPAGPGPPAADARWVDAGWLASWADGVETPPPIDNAPLLCEHGKLDPFKAAGVIDHCVGNVTARFRRAMRRRCHSTMRRCCASMASCTLSSRRVSCFFDGEPFTTVNADQHLAATMRIRQGGPLRGEGCVLVRASMPQSDAKGGHDSTGQCTGRVGCKGYRVCERRCLPCNAAVRGALAVFPALRPQS